MIVDHYSLDVSWHLQVKETAESMFPFFRLMVIDDLANRPLFADLLLDQNYFGESSSQRYLNLVPSSCTQLLGPTRFVVS